MKKFYVRLLVVVTFIVLSFNQASAQCPIGYTQSQLNWDYIDFLPSANANYTPSYVLGITPYNQNFTIGTRRVNFTMAPSASITLDGENATNTANLGSFATPGQDVQFTTTVATNTTITITFDADVANVQFSLFDLDLIQAVTIAATNTLLVPQPITIALANAGSGIIIVGSPGVAPVATGPVANYANTDNNGTINVTIPGPVRTITLTLNNAAGNIWMGDIDACVTGSFPSNWRNISQPFTGMPAYILTLRNNNFMLLDPATGRAKPLFIDPGHTNMNGMGYDPYNRILYYTYSLTATPANTKSIYKYSVDNDAISTLVADVNAAPLYIPTYEPGVTSGAGSFYNGSYYFGVESSNSGRTSGRENTVWKIDFDASQNPIRASQSYATRVDSNIAGTDRLIHDWSDIGVTNNGMMYDFDGSRGDSMYYHFNLMSGQRTQFLPSGAGNIGPKQVGIDWQENVYNMGGLPSGSPLNIGGFIVPYNYNGTLNNAQNHNVFTLPGPIFPTGSWGDCSEAFRPTCDFGDAPATYDPIPLSPAVHERDTAIRIGATWDREWNKTSSPLADADGTDEDGLAFVPIFSPGAGNYLAQVSVYNNTGSDATLIAWLDYNGNGVFDSGEACQALPVVTSMPSLQNRFLFWPSAPTTLPNGSFTYLRVRLVRTSSGMTDSNPTGYYDNGETEDYRITVDDFPLKADLLSFNAKMITSDNVELKWNSSGEDNFSGYEIQRSADNNDWNVLDFVMAKGNGLSDAVSYLYNDLRPVTGTSFYRLKLISNDGKFKYSEIRTVTIQKGIRQITLLPNPASDKVTLLINTSFDAAASIAVTDISGRVLHRQTALLRKGINNTDLPVIHKLSSGMYFVQVEIKNELFTRKLIIKKE